MRLKKFEQPLRVMQVPRATIMAREMRLKLFEVDQPLEMHDIGARNAIENFLKSTKLWKCCEGR